MRVGRPTIPHSHGLNARDSRRNRAALRGGATPASTTAAARPIGWTLSSCLISAIWNTKVNLKQADQPILSNSRHPSEEGVVATDEVNVTRRPRKANRRTPCNL